MQMHMAIASDAEQKISRSRRIQNMKRNHPLAKSANPSSGLQQQIQYGGGPKPIKYEDPDQQGELEEDDEEIEKLWGERTASMLSRSRRLLAHAQSEARAHQVEQQLRAKRRLQGKEPLRSSCADMEGPLMTETHEKKSKVASKKSLNQLKTEPIYSGNDNHDTEGYSDNDFQSDDGAAGGDNEADIGGATHHPIPASSLPFVNTTPLGGSSSLTTNTSNASFKPTKKGETKSKKVKFIPNTILKGPSRCDDDDDDDDDMVDEERKISQPVQIAAPAPSAGYQEVLTRQQGIENEMSDREWENEIARQILTLYVTSLKKEKENSSSEPSATSQSGSNMGSTSDSTRSSPTAEQSLESGRSRGPGGRGHGNGRGRNAKTQNSLKLPTWGSGASSKIPVAKSTPTYAKTGGRVMSVGLAWDPSHIDKATQKVIVNRPRVPSLIWFAGSGAIKAVWSALADEEMCQEISDMESKGKLLKCAATVEALLMARIRAVGLEDMEYRLWRQLIVACTAFGVRYCETKNWGKAMEILQRAEALSNDPNMVLREEKQELHAFVLDAWGTYYYCRGKYFAAEQHVSRALNIHIRREEWDHVGKCYLHVSAIQSRLGKHKDAIDTMQNVLDMVESSQLENGGASAQKICMISICYHNLAICQLQLKR
jgi:hypothetical protein